MKKDNRFIRFMLLRGFFLLPLFCCVALYAGPKLYLIPGQGSDQRLYKNFDPGSYDTVQLHWIMPEKNESMNSLARRMAEQIDTTQPFSIVGVSLGGMIACEMSTFLHPEKIILVSSARGREELPLRYRMLRHFPVNRILPPRSFRFGARFLQPVVEPDRRREKQTCRNMLRDKNPMFLKRSVNCIISWDAKRFDSPAIIHIHGTNDHTLPYRHVHADLTLRRGSHMMMLTEGEHVSQLIRTALNGTDVPKP